MSLIGRVVLCSQTTTVVAQVNREILDPYIMHVQVAFSPAIPARSLFRVRSALGSSPSAGHRVSIRARHDIRSQSAGVSI
jgi:hypothetical protein